MMKRMNRALVYLLAMLMALPFRAVYAAETVTYFHNDAAGTPMLATNAAGNVLWKESYEPYGGKLKNQAASTNNKIGFAGKPYDSTTGLSYMGARYYDPIVGRFTGIDPVDYQQDNLHSFNRYTYANNNPYKFVDPDGRMAFVLYFAVVAAAAALTTAAVVSGNSASSSAGPGGTQSGSSGGQSITFTPTPIQNWAPWGSQKAEEADKGDGKKDTLKPGPHAGDSIPARGPGRDFTQGERDQINDIGKTTGCHTCGTTDAGTKSGNFVPDHQPPSALNPEGNPQGLYPQCIGCSRTQGGQVRGKQYGE